QDVRYALRTLRKSPAFTCVAVVALAIGIGANTAIFSLVDAAGEHALPYPDSSRLRALWGHGPRERESGAGWEVTRLGARAAGVCEERERHGGVRRPVADALRPGRTRAHQYRIRFGALLLSAWRRTRPRANVSGGRRRHRQAGAGRRAERRALEAAVRQRSAD